MTEPSGGGMDDRNEREGTPPPLTKEQIEGHISAIKSIIKDYNRQNKADPIRLDFGTDNILLKEGRVARGKDVGEEDLSKPHGNRATWGSKRDSIKTEDLHFHYLQSFMPDLLNKVTNTLNKFATLVENASGATTMGVPSADKATASPAEGENDADTNLKNELVDLLGIDIVTQYYKKKLLYEKYCEKIKKRRQRSKIINCDVLTKKGPISLKVYKEDGTAEVIEKFKANDLQLAEWRKDHKLTPVFIFDYELKVGLEVLLNKLPSKEKDPGSFTIPYDIGHLHIDNALVALEASISLMPYTMYEKLGLGELKLTIMSLELADRSIQYPRGIAEDVLIKIDKFILPIDFVVLDMREDSRIPILLG
ncbi:uncharacterized mitochondrial protein-like protein [Tanacetum coccineum]